MPEPVARPDRLRRVALSILLGCCLLLPSCSSPARTPAPVESASVSRLTPQSTLDSWARAVRERSSADFDALVSRRDPNFAATASRIYDNLTRLGLSSLTLRLRPVEHDLSGPRRALLGPDAVVRQVAVSWRVSGDPAPAEHLIWLTFLPDGARTAVAGTIDGPSDRTAQPLWLLAPLSVARSATTTVITSAQTGTARTDPGQWLATGDSAAAAVRSRLPAGLRSRWNGRLVFAVPPTRTAFERVLGVLPGSYGQIAAVAWPEGPDPATAAVRIVANPELTGRLDQQNLDVLMTHEATHVATRSAGSPAPTWLVEGYADYLAYDAHPQTAGAAEAELLVHVRDRGAPAALPADNQFTAAAPDLRRSYTESWLACRYLARRSSAAALGRFYRAVDGGLSVGQALQSEFGLTEKELTAGWAEGLRAAARRVPRR